jgi:hypothetical protein
MKKDKPLDRRLFTAQDMRVHEYSDITPEALAEYIPDIPTGLGVHLSTAYCDARPFDPVTEVYPAFFFYTQDGERKTIVVSNPLEGGDMDWEIDDFFFDIRVPKQFDYIHWLRKCLIYSRPCVDHLLEKFFDTEVQKKVFLTYYLNWMESWKDRGYPIYLGAGVTNMLDTRGEPRDYHMEYPLDPNLSSH